MEEKVFSGYCFQLDQARIVEVELCEGNIKEPDCGYFTCVHRVRCGIGKQIAALESRQKRDDSSGAAQL